MFGLVLAGGEGKRLMPLTADRAKPAVPFGGHYRLVDLALSNLVNAGYLRIVVLTQYKSHSLDRHITTTWRLSPLLGNYVTPVPAQQRLGPHWFAGSADAIHQSLNLIYDDRPDYVCVFGADHIYRIDPRQMVARHIERGAGVTVAGIRAPLEQAPELGVIEPAADGHTIAKFREKPTDAVGLPDAPDQVYASMGIYVFTASTLIDAVTADAADERSRHDLGGNVIPALVRRGEAHVYDFLSNDVPGASEEERGYWRDVGTIDSYYQAHMDLVTTVPAFNLYNKSWPIFTWTESLPPAKFVVEEEGRTGHAVSSLDLRRRDRLGREGAPLRALARRPRALLRRGRALRAHARRRHRSPRCRAQRDPRQERPDRGGRPDRCRPRPRPRALRRLRGRRRRHRQGRPRG